MWDFSLGAYLSKLNHMMSIPLGASSCLLKRKEHIERLNSFAQSCAITAQVTTSYKRKLKKFSHDESHNVRRSDVKNFKDKFRYIELDLTVEDALSSTVKSDPTNNDIVSVSSSGNVKNLLAQPVKTQFIIGEPLTTTVYTSYEESMSELNKYCLSKGFGTSYIESSKRKNDPDKRIYTIGCELREMREPRILPTVNTTCKSTGCRWR